VAALSAVGAACAVVDEDDVVVWASPGATAWGMVRAGRLADPALRRAAAEARAGAEAVEAEWLPKEARQRNLPVLLVIRAAPLVPGQTVVMAEDRSAARRIDDVRRDFVANVSHELKTPVAALTLLAEAVEDASDEPEAVRRFAARMGREVSRLSALVIELIDLSRLQGDAPLSHATVVPVDDLVSEALDAVRTRAGAQLIDLRATGEPGLSVFGDRDQLVMAVRNLLDNAINYSPERTRVVVAASLVGDMVEISVSDQGIGIPERDRQRIFERFYRVDPARSRATGGTGLGLSIVKHVCENHGGEVTVWSAEGAGSTFTLRLPAQVAQGPGVDAAEPAERGSR